MSEERMVSPAFYPNFANAEKWNAWDGSEDAQTWAQLLNFRESCILETISRVAEHCHHRGDIAGVVAALWNIDREEVVKITKKGSGSEKGSGSAKG